MADGGPSVETMAFADGSGPLLIPGPLIRVTSGTEVRVSVDGRSPNEFLGVIGVSSFRVHESGTATAITGPPGRAG